jgi:heme exporter protein D
MSWGSFSEFLSMRGYALFVWGSFGMCAAVVVAELTLLALQRRALIRELQRDHAAGAGQSDL